MKGMSTELKVEEVNQSLSQVRGLRFDLPKTVLHKGGSTPELDPDTLKVEETNDMLAKITGRTLSGKALTESEEAAEESEDVDYDSLVEEDFLKLATQIALIVKEGLDDAAPPGGEGGGVDEKEFLEILEHAVHELATSKKSLLMKAGKLAFKKQGSLSRNLKREL